MRTSLDSQLQTPLGAEYAHYGRRIAGSCASQPANSPAPNTNYSEATDGVIHIDCTHRRALTVSVTGRLARILLFLNSGPLLTE